MSVQAFQERIISSAPRHTELLQSLTGSSYGRAAIQQNVAYITELQLQIPIEEKKLEKLHWRVEKERSEYEMYQNNYIKKLAYKLKGRQNEYANQTSAEERKYHETLSIQSKAQSQLETMKTQLAEAQSKQPEFEAAATNHSIWQSELLALYDSIFALPHPAFPAETKALSFLRRAQSDLTTAQVPFDLESQTLALLADAHKYYTWSLNNVRNALKTASSEASFGIGVMEYRALGAQAVAIEMNAMAQAQSQAAQAEMLVDTAVRLRPGVVRAVQGVSLAQGDALGTGGKPFNTFQFRQKMIAAEKDLQRAQVEVGRELEATKGRAGELEDEVKELKIMVEEAEEKLREVRAEIWRRVVDGEELFEGGSGDGAASLSEAPPDYVP